MEYVHELNNEFKENIKMMLCSPDPETIGLAIEILNHVDLSNEETKKYIMELVLDTDCGLCVSFQNKEGYFMIDTPENVNDLNKKNFYFYSANLISSFIK